MIKNAIITVLAALLFLLGYQHDKTKTELIQVKKDWTVVVSKYETLSETQEKEIKMLQFALDLCRSNQK